MLISELSRRTGVPVATIKFYIREALLDRGTVTSATRAQYGEEHEDRLRLIHALAGARGLPLGRVKEILALIDEPVADPIATMGRAVGALPPYADDPEANDEFARAAIEAAGWTYDPRFAAVQQLEVAIRAVRAAGLSWDDTVVRRYADSITSIAVAETTPMSQMTAEETIRYAVLGTALFEPVILALRRLAHQHLLVERSREADSSAGRGQIEAIESGSRAN